MDIQVEQADKFTHKLSVTIPSQDVDKAFKDSFKKVAKSARIPGFRPGKIPRGVLEARFGTQIKSDVFQQLLDSSLQAALIQKELNISNVCWQSMFLQIFNQYILSHFINIQIFIFGI